jgi:hypothetical protein
VSHRRLTALLQQLFNRLSTSRAYSLGSRDHCLYVAAPIWPVGAWAALSTADPGSVLSSTSSPMLPSVAAPGGSAAMGAPAAATAVSAMAASFVSVSEGWFYEDLTGDLRTITCVSPSPAAAAESSISSFSVTVGMELIGTVGGTGSPVACVLIQLWLLKAEQLCDLTLPTARRCTTSNHGA